MIGYRPHPSLLGGNGGGSGGAGVDQTARDAVAASDAVNATQATEIGGLKAADSAFETRVAAGETKDGLQDTAISGLQTVDTALAGRATALEGRATSGEAKDAAQDADLVSHAGRLTAGETKDAAQDAEITALHGADTTLAGRATALEGRATTGEAKDASQDADLVAHGTRLTSAEANNAAQDTDLAGLHTADTALAGRATALETRATSGESKAAAQDADISSLKSADTALQGRATNLETRATSGETKDTNQDGRIGTNETNIRNLQTQVRQLANLKGSVWLGSYRVKAADAKTGFDVNAHAPAGTIEVDFTAVGGGSSGVASGTANPGGTAHGGVPGAVESTGRIPYVANMTLDMVIGAGGPRKTVTSTSSNADGANSGSATTLTLKVSGSAQTTLVAKGGAASPAWENTLFDAAIDHGSRSGGTPGRASSSGTSAPGSADRLTNSMFPDGRVARNGPGGGGAATSRISTSPGRGGYGADVRYTYRPEGPGYSDNLGGKPSLSPAMNGTPSQSVPEAGRNPNPEKANTYGSGGGGTTSTTGSNTHSGPGGDGGYPGAGGGGAWGPAASDGTVSITAGAGGDGCVDINYYGVPQQ